MSENIDVFEKLNACISCVISDGSFKKAVFSKSACDEVIKASAEAVKIKGETMIQLEIFRKDGKAHHKNIDVPSAAEQLCEFAKGFSQTNLLTQRGNVEVRVSKKGKATFIGKLSSEPIGGNCALEKHDHDREKNYILSPEKTYPFLTKLGVCDENGRIFDKKRAKFRQINRFLEIVDGIYDKMPKEGELLIYDLCCGKSYLTFAVYYFLTEIKKRRVEMHGIDLKEDMMTECAAFAKELGYDGLHFSCGNINEVTVTRAPDMVISLHACDVATDIVLSNSQKWGSKIILSSPCCQHEIYSQIDKSAMTLLGKYPILNQKFCAILTDALRCLWLEIMGYDVEAIEFIDPDETPKNVLIRAIDRKTPISCEKQKSLENKYREICRSYGISPTLSKNLEKT
ncbi:MAG: methyltransferase [Clostridia bacterium]|nr:methyltransferase [Clostridia bacterium]